jgi:hypothetical protein
MEAECNVICVCMSSGSAEFRHEGRNIVQYVNCYSKRSKLMFYIIVGSYVKTGGGAEIIILTATLICACFILS